MTGIDDFFVPENFRLLPYGTLLDKLVSLSHPLDCKIEVLKDAFRNRNDAGSEQGKIREETKARGERKPIVTREWCMGKVPLL